MSTRLFRQFIHLGDAYGVSKSAKFVLSPARFYIFSPKSGSWTAAQNFVEMPLAANPFNTGASQDG
jgi:hypothetical protein